MAGDSETGDSCCLSQAGDISICQLLVTAWCGSPECHLGHKGNHRIKFPSRRMRCRKRLLGRTFLVPWLQEKELCWHHLPWLFDCVGPPVGSAPRKAQGVGFAYPWVSKRGSQTDRVQVSSEAFTNHREEKKAGGKRLGEGKVDARS